MKTIFVILILAVMFCLIAGFLTAVGFGIGFLITACTSSIEPGQAFIAGCIIATASTFFLLKLLRSVQRDMNDDEDIPDGPTEGFYQPPPRKIKIQEEAEVTAQT